MPVPLMILMATHLALEWIDEALAIIANIREAA